MELAILKEYDSIHHMWYFATKNWVIYLSPRYCGLLLPGTPNNSLEGSRYNQSGLYIFEKHLNCTQITIKFQHERSANGSRKFFSLQRHRIDIPPPLLNKLWITAITADAGTHFIILCGDKYFERKESCLGTQDNDPGQGLHPNRSIQSLGR